MFIHISDPIDSGRFSAVERGKANAMEPKMDQAISRFVGFSAKVHIEHEEDCSVEYLIDKFRKVVRGVDLNLITVENFKAAVDHQKELHAEQVAREVERALSLEQMRQPSQPDVGSDITQSKAISLPTE